MFKQNFIFSRIFIDVIFIGILLILNLSSFSQKNHVDFSYKSGVEIYNHALQFYNSGEYDTSILLLKQASLNFDKSGHNLEYSRCLTKISNSFLVQGLYDSATIYVNLALDFIHETNIQEHDIYSELFYIRGNIFTRTGEIDSAEYFLNKSLSYCNRYKNDSLLAQVIKSLGNIDYARGNYLKALDLYQKSLEIETSRSDFSNKLMASLYQNMGIVYSIIGYHDSAKIYFKKSIILKENLLAADDPQLANGFLNYGRFLQTIGDQYEGLEYLDKAENIYLTRYGNDYFGLASIYFNKGSIYILLYDYDKSLKYHERAVELYKKQYNSNHVIFNELYNNIGIIYEKLDKLEKAIEYYFKSLNQNSNPETLLKVYGNLGRCYDRLDKPIEAEKYYLIAINKSIELLGDSHTQTANSYLDYGIFCDEREKFIIADKYLNKAYSIFIENFGKKNRDVSSTLTALGQHQQNINYFNEALEYYQQALVSFIEDYNETDIYNNPGLKILDHDLNLFYTIQNKALAFYYYYMFDTDNTKDLIASLETSQLAIQLLEIIKSSFGEDNTKLIITNEVNDIYDLAVMVSSELYEKTREEKYLNSAFEFSEKGKATVLLSSLREFEAMEVVNIPTEIRENENILSKEISLYKKLVFDENQKSDPDSSKILTWKRQIFDKTKSHDSLISSIENQYPEYYNLKYNFDVNSLNDIQELLTQKEAFIEYKISDTILTAFLVTSDTAILHNGMIGNDFSQRISDFVSSINKVSDDFGSKNEYVLYALESHELYKILIEPLGLSKDYSNIIIIPDGVLGYLNFETLIKNKPDTTKVNYRNLDYLIRAYTLSYGYSGTVLFHRNISTSHSKKLLAMAPDYDFGGKEIANNSISVRDLTNNLNSLDHIVEEVKRVNEIYKGQLFIGEEATEANFKANAHNFNILHFAMHTLVNDENPMNSKLVFTLNNDTVEDGFLNTYEIYNLDLNAELAVLSACKTGVGKLSKGEGIMSLARGFLYAGVPGIVMTLWEVEDIASANVITGFYKNLKKGLNKDVALRKSKLAYLESADPLHSHPYFWAAYVQIGSNNPVISYSNKMYFVYAAILLCVVGILYFIRKKRTIR